MPKTRMTVADREAICKAIIAHKFDPLVADLEREEHSLAAQVWNSLYTDAEKRWIKNAPKGALPTTECFVVNCGGPTHHLYFGPYSYPEKRAARTVFAKHERRIDKAATDPLAEAICNMAAREGEMKAERNTLRSTVKGVLSGYRNFEDAIEGWPEAASFVRARQIGASAPVLLPVPTLVDLSAKLDLPPDEQPTPSTAQALRSVGEAA